jgi:hypothetical protein
MLKKVWNWMMEQYKPRDDLWMSYSDLGTMLHRDFPNAAVYVSDDLNHLIYQADMKKLLQLNFVRFRRWIKEDHDCDNFAKELAGIVSSIAGSHAFGIVLVNTPQGAHALNCFIDEFGRFNYVEPQSSTIFRTKEGYTPFLIWI